MVKCLEPENRENGGRGIGNVVESFFLNPLSEFLFDVNAQAGQRVGVGCDENGLLFKQGSQE
jgi:ATP-dependent Clp protease ATP-binding subunit ClpA